MKTRVYLQHQNTQRKKLPSRHVSSLVFYQQCNLKYLGCEGLLKILKKKCAIKLKLLLFSFIRLKFNRVLKITCLKLCVYSLIALKTHQ
jgi:hypothetical protein